MPEYTTPRIPAGIRIVDELAVPATRRDVLDVLGKLAENAGDPAVRKVCGEVWEEFTVIWRHGPPEQPTT